jgi:hypothetical protein
MTYGVPGESPGRHVVFDAPEAKDGSSVVTAAVKAGRCVVNIAPGGGGGATGHPVIFDVASAKDGCAVKLGVDAPGAVLLSARGAASTADEDDSTAAPHRGLRWWYRQLRVPTLAAGLSTFACIACMVIARRRRSRATASAQL